MIHPALRSLMSRLGPVCFGDFSSGQPTPKPADDITIGKTVRAVLDLEQVSADHLLFGRTLDEEERLLDWTKKLRNDANSFERRKAEWEDFRARRSWVASAIVTFRRFGYEGLADPNLIPDSERYKSQY